MSITGLLYHILIEVQFLKTIKHDKRHSEGDPFVHTLMVMKHSKPTVVAQLAALFHDIGKPSTQKIEGDKISFIDHEDIGADGTRLAMERLKFDNDTTNKVVKLVKLHMRPHFLVKASVKAYRRFIRDSDTLLGDVLDLAEADSLGRLPVRNFIPDIRVKVEETLKMPIKIRRVAILDGNEIMAALGIGPGKRIGEIQKFLIELEDDFAEYGLVLTKEDAVERIKTLDSALPLEALGGDPSIRGEYP
jgi:poly(A) polymerase